LAEAYLMTGALEKARAVCPEGIESEVDTELLEAGKLLYMLNKKEAAKTQFEKYIAISNNRNARGLVSQFYRNHGEFELGEQWIKASIQHNPDYMGWRRNLARHYFFFGKKKKAFAILNEAKEIAPDDLNTLALIAILRYFDNPNTAQSYFEATGKVNPNFLKLWKGLELMRNNEFKSADNAYSDLANEFNTFWFEMVEYKYLQMKIRQGKKEKAIELLNEILIKAWFVNYQLLSTDKALDPIREFEGFKKLMRRYFPEKMN
jgi:tetratricopeptide (TPR) repeat protein